MADAIEVTIESVMLDHLRALVFSPAIPIAYPEVVFTVPDPVTGASWLKADFLPSPTAGIAIPQGSMNQHQGIFQVSVYYNRNEGELKPARIASSIIAWFTRGTILTKSGFRIDITEPPYRGRMLVDAAWVYIPVSIPYLAFAPDPPAHNPAISASVGSSVGAGG